jgi:hypothetical protein
MVNLRAFRDQAASVSDGSSRDRLVASHQLVSIFHRKFGLGQRRVISVFSSQIAKGWIDAYLVWCGTAEI